MNRILLALMIGLVTALSCVAAQETGQSRLDPAKAEASRKYPPIVLYSVSWCPHCRAAKEYLTSHNIPYINRDVEQDQAAMADLTGKYESQGVPVLVIGKGKDEVVLRGFTPDSFQESLKKARSKQ